MTEDRLNFLIHDLAKDRAQLFNQLMEPHGVTRAQAWAIGALSRKRGITQIELANTLNMTPVAAGTLLNRMEAAGWIERRPDKSDARVRRVHLTESSAPLRARIDEAARQVNAASLQGFSAAEVETLIGLLLRMRNNLEGGEDGQRQRA
jgi:DNA-binding MarR family transcriptional regulator